MSEIYKTLDEVKTIIKSLTTLTYKEKDLPNAVQLKMSNGAIINWFKTGKISIQGKNTELLRNLLSGTQTSKLERKVFVVYGHNDQCKIQLEAILRRWGIEPVIFDQSPAEGRTIIEKLEDMCNSVRFGIVLATPDDEGRKRGTDEKLVGRVRQNVILELGLLLAKLGRNRVAVLLKQEDDFEKPSDISGLIYIPFKDNVDNDAGKSLAKELSRAGIRIEVDQL